MDKILLEKEIVQKAILGNGGISKDYIFRLKLLDIDRQMLRDVAEKIGRDFSAKYTEGFLENYYDSFLDIVTGYCNVQLAIFTVEWDVEIIQNFQQLIFYSKVLLEKIAEQTKQVRPIIYLEKKNKYIWLENKADVLIDDVWQYEINKNEGYCLFTNKSKVQCMDKDTKIKVDLFDCSNITMEYFWLYLSTSRKTSLLKLNFTNQPVKKLEALFNLYKSKELI